MVSSHEMVILIKLMRYKKMCQEQKLLILLLSLLLLSLIDCQPAPFYSLSPHFHTGQGSVVNTYTKSTPDFTFSVPTAFTISTAGHRTPFHGVISTNHFEIETKEVMYFWTTIESVTSTSFFFRIYYMDVGSGMSSYGFVINSVIRFSYMLVEDSFPDKYICAQIPITAVPFSIATNSFKTFSFLTTGIVTPAPLALSIDTIFIHTFPYAQITSKTTPLDSSFQLNFVFKVNSATNFSLTINAKYPVSIQEFEIKVFMYNKADFDGLYVRIDYQTVGFGSLLVGSGSVVTGTYTASFVVDSGQIFYGISTFEFSKYEVLGFEFVIDPTHVGMDYTIRLKNLQAASSVPHLEIAVLLASSLHCPTPSTLIDPSLTTCYPTTCPTQHFPSTQQLGITGIFICQPCHYSCG